MISGTIFAEPVVSALLAWLILSEKPGVATVVGGAVVLSGLFLLLVRSPASYGTHRMKSLSASQNAARSKRLASRSATHLVRYFGFFLTG